MQQLMDTTVQLKMKRKSLGAVWPLTCGAICWGMPCLHLSLSFSWLCCIAMPRMLGFIFWAVTQKTTGRDAFWELPEYFLQHFSIYSYEENFSKLCDLSFFKFFLWLPQSNLWWWTLEQNSSHWQTRIVNLGDTNLIVCYLDAGRPMWCSYLCDRCSTSLHLQSQPAPSLQAVDLNSSESTQWEGKW